VRPDYADPWTWSDHYYGLIEEGMRQDDCLMVCVAHKGRHPYVDGGCHELPKPLPKRERVRIANQDREQPAAPVRVQFDVDDLALALRSVIPTGNLPEPAPTSKTVPEPARSDSEPATKVRTVEL
jgi:hypothetical protein